MDWNKSREVGESVTYKGGYIIIIVVVVVAAAAAAGATVISPK